MQPKRQLRPNRQSATPRTRAGAGRGRQRGRGREPGAAAALAGHEVRVCPRRPGGPAGGRGRSSREVVLLDIGLPGMDGYEVARRLRAEPGTGKLLLVALTGYGQEEDPAAPARRASTTTSSSRPTSKRSELLAYQLSPSRRNSHSRFALIPLRRPGPVRRRLTDVRVHRQMQQLGSLRLSAGEDVGALFHAFAGVTQYSDHHKLRPLFTSRPRAVRRITNGSDSGPTA